MKGLALVVFTTAFCVAEAVIGIGAGIHDRSASLESFGLDSVIEVLLGVVLAWRLAVEAQGAETERLKAVERRANRIVGAGFYALAAFIVANSALTLWRHVVSHPGGLGLGLAGVAVLSMPVLAIAKKRVGKAIGSEALAAEAGCTMICAYMSAILLVGLAATRYLGCWWADPVAAFGLLYWVAREGHEAFERAADRPG
ncbi:MAG TPA: cation transporter [Oscillatoriaceae cyanobacterium]